MEAHLHMWLGLLVRWLHFIAGVAWIGASFYFNWLESHLERRNQPQGIAGDLWAVHGGGFYYLKKFAVSPAELPPQLHWFKWEAYVTWLSGMALLIIVFYWSAQTYMLKPEAAVIGPAGAIGIGVLSLLLSWIVYDLLCCSKLARREWLLGVLIFAWFVLLAWLLDTWLSGRAAYIHVGAAIGTVMVANVFRVIIPAQKDLVAAVTANRSPDAARARRALQRSRHNNYFTLPVLFIMLSGHYPATYGHPHGWLVLLVFSLAAVAIRHYFNIRHLPGFRAWPLLPALLLLAGLVVYSAPTDMGSGTFDRIEFSSIRSNVPDPIDPQTAEIYTLIEQRCVACHAQVPTFAGFPAAPLGVELDSPQKLLEHAERVYQSAVISRVMPPGNLTQMTDSERQLVARWFENLDDSEKRDR